MEIKTLNQRPGLEHNKRLKYQYILFNEIIAELKNKELPDELVVVINTDIDFINSITESGKEFEKLLRQVQSKILKLIEKETKIVTRNHYRNIWLAIGMAVFGIPLGVALGIILGNMAFIGIGLPIGMTIGIAVGTSMDNKAKENGKQLDIEIK